MDWIDAPLECGSVHVDVSQIFAFVNLCNHKLFKCCRNSKPLLVSEGYWAEPWPVAETPLCAVVDPARDYRWHAFRCGGPETAAFLCEMESKFAFAVEFAKRLIKMKKTSVPEWALHCTNNPDITVQYISDSGAVQLSRQCDDTLKEISCQGKMTQMAMYDELRCPEEFSTTQTDTTDEAASTGEIRPTPEVIIKNAQKMLEDVLSSDPEVDMNVLEIADVKNKLDLMMGDQPEEPAIEDEKKKVTKLAEKKEVQAKKKNVKKETRKREDSDIMMGDEPAAAKEESSTKLYGLSTDRERRDVSETTTPSADDNEFSTEETSTVSIPEESTPATAESTTEVTVTTTTEEATTKNIVQGHPLFHNHAVFKEPISIDNVNNTERKDVSNNDDHFIPPMLLVKARFNAPKSVDETADETKEATTDVSTSSLSTEPALDTIADEKNATQNVSESSEATTEEVPASSASSTSSTIEPPTTLTEKPILIEKRNDPRLGLIHVTTTTTQAAVETSTHPMKTSTESQSTTVTEELTTATEEPSTLSSSESSSSDQSSTTEAQTEAESSTTGMSTSPSGDSESSTHESTTSNAPDTTSASPTLAALKLSEAPLTTQAKPVTQMRNDIDDPESQENDEENPDHHHLESNLNNEDNYQPYKPNRHRSITNNEHHHGPGFSLGKILG